MEGPASRDTTDRGAPARRALHRSPLPYELIRVLRLEKKKKSGECPRRHLFSAVMGSNGARPYGWLARRAEARRLLQQVLQRDPSHAAAADLLAEIKAP